MDNARLELRPYQADCLAHAKERNTIVHLPTGYGKTLIAARLVEHYLECLPDQKIGFLVPTVALVGQQSAYLERHCSVGMGTRVFVQQLVGKEQASWGTKEWTDASKISHIFCGTPAIFQQVFIERKFFNLKRFSLLVFDECHNTIGNSPMAAVMRDAVLPFYNDNNCHGVPRILGLTASFDNGNGKSLAEKRRKLEALLQAKILCPRVESRIEDDSYISVSWERNPFIDDHKQSIAEHVSVALEPFAKIKEMAKVIRRCSHVYEELGLKALFCYIDKVIICQINEKIRGLEELIGDTASIDLASKLQREMPHLQKVLAQLNDSLETETKLHQFDEVSDKADRLVSLVSDILEQHENAYRGIIFVEQVALVSTLALLLNEKLSDHSFGAVAGGGYQSKSDRDKQLRKFDVGELDVLVSSAALEEGLDVADCGFVIRFSSVATTKAHIQGSGRARHRNAKIYYFENNPTIERQKEASLNATATNHSLSLNTQQMKDAATSMAQKITWRHPYPFNSNEGQVNVFNCKQIFNTYCSMVLGETVKPKQDLFRYQYHKPGEPKIIERIRFPTPESWKEKNTKHFEEFWQDVNVEELFSGGDSGTKSKKTSEKEEMMFVYMVVVHLREQKYLNCHNRPDPIQQIQTRRCCKLDDPWPDDSISIRNRIFQSYP